MSETPITERSGAALPEAKVLAVARFGFPGSASHAVWDEPLDDDAFALHVGRCISQKLVGVLAAAVAAGAAPVTEQQFDVLSGHHEEAMHAAIELEQLAVVVADVLAGAGVSSTLLKGSALAHTVALFPEQRTFGDVDVLVRSADVDSAVAALTRAGAQRRMPELRVGFDRRFAKSVSMVWGKREVDLHRTLAPGPYGLSIIEEDLHADLSSFSVGGHRLRTFSPEMHLIHGCYHAALGDVAPALGSLRDIALLLGTPEIDNERIVNIVGRWGGNAVVARALSLSREALSPTPTALTKWGDRQTTSRRDRALLRSYQTQDRRFRRTATASLLALPTWRDRADFLRSVARPSPEHRAAKDALAEG